ncbi:MAG: glycoside hydrolase family 5 protein [Asticcacaulis sp.]|nr:glycoside hydrolase family 5 protein [Asticcacaulis sp.]
MVLSSHPANAQFAGPGYRTDTKDSAGRELDNLKDQVNSFNNLFKSDRKFTEVSPEDQVVQMGAGINWGGYDPWWDGGKSVFNPNKDIARMKAAGFTTLRVPLMAFKHIVDTQGHLDPKYLDKLDAVVQAALKNNMTVILDEHDFDDCEKNTDACAVLLPNVWYDLSEHYKDAPNSVIFELLNEPHGQIDDKVWNDWVAGLVGIVRETNPTRNIIVGPIGWNSIDKLETLKLPAADHHIIATFHYYLPMEFTHQGASWAGAELEKARGVRWTGTAEEMARLNADFDKASAWGKANGRPIFLGEYGTYGKFNTNMDDRVAWTHAVSKAADDRGFARAYWYYSDGDGFGVYDSEKGQWVQPILNALVPKSK